MRFVRPKVYYMGVTTPNLEEIKRYLTDSGNEGFIEYIDEAIAKGITPEECMISMFAKLCYKSLTVGHNPNISKVRDIEDNLRSILDTAHGSILEHIQFNFLFTNVSRVFTHELVRHRIGTAFSQTSGRYVRLDEIELVLDPILEPIKDDVRIAVENIEQHYQRLVEKSGVNDVKDFNTKKKITSALRRIAPNGLANEIAFSCNLRAIRHIILLRTARHAEWEIRKVFGDIYNILSKRYPIMFEGATVEMVDGLPEVSGLKTQPYEK
jgi:thymidylate synthase (FAD)